MNILEMKFLGMNLLEIYIILYSLNFFRKGIYSVFLPVKANESIEKNKRILNFKEFFLNIIFDIPLFFYFKSPVIIIFAIWQVFYSALDIISPEKTKENFDRMDKLNTFITEDKKLMSVQISGAVVCFMMAYFIKEVMVYSEFLNNF